MIPGYRRKPTARLLRVPSGGPSRNVSLTAKNFSGSVSTFACEMVVVMRRHLYRGSRWRRLIIERIRIVENASRHPHYSGDCRWWLYWPEIDVILGLSECAPGPEDATYHNPCSRPLYAGTRTSSRITSRWKYRGKVIVCLILIPHFLYFVRLANIWHGSRQDISPDPTWWAPKPRREE